MVVFNYSGAEINAKVVYYGPALSGKTTNLEYIYEKMPANAKGKMVSMKTRTDRTLFFDFLPIELGEISGYRTRILLYTVPGQVYYNATRKLVLKGADAVVFVADSTPSKMQENIESLRNLEENLNEHGLTLDTIPWIMQYNKRDADRALPVETLSEKLNLLNVPSFEAVATTGTGIYETFQAIAGMLYNTLAERLDNSQPAAPGVPRPASPPVSLPPEPKSEPEPVQAARKVAPMSANQKDKSVDDALDSALREMNVAETVARGDATPPQEKPKSLKDRLKAKVVEVGRSFGPSAAPPDAGKVTDDEALADFQFASLEEENIDDDVGRTIDFEDTQTLKKVETGDGEFVLDPFQTRKPEEKVSASALPDPPLPDTPEPQIHREPESKLDVERELKIDVRPEPEVAARPEPKVRPEPEVAARPEPKVRPEPEVAVRSEPKVRPEPEVAARPEPTVRPEPEVAVRSEPKAEHKTPADTVFDSPPPVFAEPPLPASPESDEVAISVPVLISRTQLRKSLPIRLTLEIRVIDEDI